MYDLLDLPPEQKQAMVAEILRRRQQSGALQEANMRANQFNPMAAASQMANNPALARAAEMAAKNAQSQYKPLSLGAQGYSVPSSGEFIPSPMYEDEKKAQRESKSELQQEKLAQQRERDRERYENQRSRDQDMFENRRSLAMTLAAMRGSGGSGADDKAAAKKDKDMNTSLQKFSNTLEKAGVPEFESALGVAESRLKKHQPGELPGYGRLKGYFPSTMLNDEEQMSRSDFQSAANILLKSRSGAAVTTSEERRFLAEVASGSGMSEAAMRHGWENLRRNFDKRKQNLLASVPPEALEEYNQRSGAGYAHATGEKPAASPSWLPPGAKILSVREK